MGKIYEITNSQRKTTYRERGGGGARPSIKTQEKLHRHCNTTLLIKNATSVIRVNKRQQVFHVQQ